MFMYRHFYVYVFLLLCTFLSVYSLSLSCSVYCLCVNVYCTAVTVGLGGVVVKALPHYSDGPGIDSRWCHWGFFQWYPRQNHVP